MDSFVFPKCNQMPDLLGYLVLEWIPPLWRLLLSGADSFAWSIWILRWEGFFFIFCPVQWNHWRFTKYNEHLQVGLLEKLHTFIHWFDSIMCLLDLMSHKQQRTCNSTVSCPAVPAYPQTLIQLCYSSVTTFLGRSEAEQKMHFPPF